MKIFTNEEMISYDFDFIFDRENSSHYFELCAVNDFFVVTITSKSNLIKESMRFKFESDSNAIDFIDKLI